MNRTIQYLISTIGFMFIAFINTTAQSADHIDMELNFKDSTALVKADYYLTIENKSDSLYFLLNPEFQIDTITSEDLLSYKLSQKEGRPFPVWLLNFRKNLNEGEEVKISFEYQIDLVSQNHLSSNWIELNIDKLWVPNHADLNNQFSYELTISNLPRSYTFIGHTNAEVFQSGPKITVRKEQPWYEVLVLAGKDMKKWMYDDEITIITNETTHDTTLYSMGEIVRNSIDLYNNSFGHSDPIKEFTIVLRNTSRKELGYQTSRNNMIITGTEFNDYANLSHEVAHFWWNKANFIEEPWLNESFANYSMYKVIEKYDTSNYNRLLAKNKALIANSIPVSEASLFANDAEASYYHKGAILLLELENRIGNKKMEELLSLCVKNEIKTTEGFLEAIETVTDLETRTYFAESLSK